MLDISQLDIPAQLREIERMECEDSLYLFLRAAWRYIDPAPWVDGWPIEAVAEHLAAVCDGEIRRLIINIPPRCGKQVADDTPVLTTQGWTTHGELKVGDEVFHPSGKPTRIIDISDKTPSDMRVEFFDGSVFYCHENHEWSLYSRANGRYETVETRRFIEPRYGRWGQTTKSIKRVLLGGRAAHQLPLIDPIQFPEHEFELPPYVLGAWLGDGTAGKPCITHAPGDSAVVERIASYGYPITAVCTHATTGVLTTYFAGDGRKVAPRLTRELRSLGIFTDKAIPQEYLHASVGQRLELLGGLLDTDGHVDRNSRCIFSGANRNLVDGVAELALSFGWRVCITETPPSLSSSGIQGKKTIWTVAFQPTISIPTALPRKRIRRFVSRRRIGLKSVTRDPSGKIGHCIQVDADDGLYLIGKHLTPTHNSSICSVAFPAWVWAQEYQGPTCGPGVQFVGSSYATQLAVRDSVKCRRLIESPWYQGLWKSRFTLSTDQNVKSRFANNKGGERLTTSVSAGVTGEGGNIILCDDPNAANEAFSEANIEATKAWWDGTLSTRLNDPKTGAFIVIQQRLAEDDLTGHILEKEADGWCHLVLPMHYEADRSFITPIGWKDPREREGQLLWPERFGNEEVKALELALGPTLAAGQLEQRPEPKGGGVIKREWWKMWGDKNFPRFDYILASLDTAYTIKTENDFSALTIWGVFTEDTVAVPTRAIGPDGRPTYDDRVHADVAPKVMLMGAWQERLPLHELVTKVAEHPTFGCTRMKVDKLLIENKAAGISVAQEIRRIYGAADFAVQLHDPGAQDKLARLYSVQHLFAEGIIHAPDKEWAEMVITQVGQFPRGKHDDLVDTCSMGIRHLRDMGLLTRSAERLEELEMSRQYQGRPPAPLYPA